MTGSAIDPSSVRAFTFDCYGTLVDWETGLAAALPDALVAAARDRRALLAAYAASEARLEAVRPDAAYPEILGAVFDDLAVRFLPELVGDREARDRFRFSVGDWPVFEETAAALRELAKHAPLFVLSNVDEASFAKTRERLGVVIEDVWTAEAIGSYKPDPANFAYAKARLRERGIEPEQVLHVAESQFHDVIPGRAAGFRTVWVDRGGSASGGEQEGAEPDLRVGSLSDLVERLFGRG